MRQDLFDIQFAADLTPGTDIAAARRIVQSQFEVSGAAVDSASSDSPLTVARGVNREAALRYQGNLLDFGVLLRIVPSSAQADERTAPSGRGSVPAFGRIATAINHVFHDFEKMLAAILLVLISLVAMIAVVELCFVLYKDLTSGDGFLLDLDELFEVFGMFLLVLIAVELMASIYMYMMDKSVHVEMMLLIAVTALTRKVVVLDLEAKGDPALYMIGLAALLGVLIGGYYLMKRIYPLGPPGGDRD